MKKILLACSLLLLTACGQNHDDALKGPFRGKGGEIPAPSFHHEDLNPDNFPNVEQSIYGQWKALDLERNADGITQQTYFFFREGRAGLGVNCYFPDKTLSATLTTSAVIGSQSPGNVDITWGSRTTVTERDGENERSCEAELRDEDLFQFHVSGDRLELTKSSGATRIFTRYRGPVINRTLR